MKKIGGIFLFAIAFIFTSCSLNSSSGDQENLNGFSNPHPANYATGQPLSLTLSWDDPGYTKYDVYLSKYTPPGIIIARGITEKNYTVSGLSYESTYFWKVVGFDNNGNSYVSPIWQFSTSDYGSGSGNGAYFIDYDSDTELPNYVKTLFELIDDAGFPVDNLTIDDLEIYDDGEIISESESFILLEQYLQNNYVMKIALVLDNSTSLRDVLDDIKSAAIDFVNGVVDDYHKVAVFKFSETTQLVQDFTSDVSQVQAAINSITVGQPSTDLYGAVIAGTSSYEENVDRMNIETGATVIFTDGTDTQGSHTFEQALEAVNGKRVYTVGLGEDINTDILSQIGQSGFFHINETSELIQIFEQIKTDIENYTKSFYWLTYASPKRGGYMHTLEIRKKDNPLNSTVTVNYSSSGFFSAPAGLYFNPTATNPEGITEISIPINSSKTVIAYSFYYPHPSYSWEITQGGDLIDIEYTSTGNNEITINAGDTKGDAVISVEDTQNSLQKNLTVHITD